MLFLTAHRNILYLITVLTVLQLIIIKNCVYDTVFKKVDKGSARQKEEIKLFSSGRSDDRLLPNGHNASPQSEVKAA